MTTTVTASTDVDVPVRVAYDQWTQFESFPEFLGGVESVTQLDDTLTHWVVSIGGVKREFDAEITDQVPDDHVSWRAIGGEVVHNGRVSFTTQGADSTRVDLAIEWEPKGLIEKAGSALQLDDAQVKSDLKRFKEYIEHREMPDGAWRGEIHGGEETAPDRSGGAGSATNDPGTGARRDEGVRGADPDLNV